MCYLLYHIFKVVLKFNATQSYYNQYETYTQCKSKLSEEYHTSSYYSESYFPKTNVKGDSMIKKKVSDLMISGRYERFLETFVMSYIQLHFIKFHRVWI